MVLFPFADYWWFYLGFTAFVLVMLALDLGVFHRKAHEVSFREATLWTVFWIGLALVFNWFFYQYTQSKNLALEFLTGFLIEKSLAIDNIFIFAVVFSYFQVPKLYQHRVLFWGILGALTFRGLFIALGSELMKYEWVILFFGALLIFTGFKMFFAGTEQKSLDQNTLLRFLKKFLRVDPHHRGQEFFVRKNGVLFVTPLFLALAFLEMTDIVFAVDSVPAIFSITKEPLIVFTSNIFAILGLRSMYFMLAGSLDRFVYIKYGLALVLIFVGLKMVYLNHLFDGKFPTAWSLLIIATFVGGSILASLFKRPELKTNP